MRGGEFRVCGNGGIQKPLRGVMILGRPGLDRFAHQGSCFIQTGRTAMAPLISVHANLSAKLFG